MAYADYRLCDVCGGKAFYDANLNYDIRLRGDDDDWTQQEAARGYKLDYLGDWAVICKDCAERHRCVIEPRSL